MQLYREIPVKTEAMPRYGVYTHVAKREICGKYQLAAAKV